jgi:predicted ABC-type ATPase
MPWMWLVAGPNGSGQSTFVNSAATSVLPGNPFTKFNPDDLSKVLREKDSSLSTEQADLQAVCAIDAEVAQAVEERKSFLVETVLSSDKHKATVERAVECGYSVGLIYVTLHSADLNIARVKLRAHLGGHDVPADKIVKRWERSLCNLVWFVQRAHVAFIYDNSGPGTKGAELIASKEAGRDLRFVKRGVNSQVEKVLEVLLRD